MDKKTTGLIAVIVTSVLCGLPGLAGLCIGPLAIFGSLLPDSGMEQADANIAIGTGIFMICLSIVFIAIPIVVGFLTLGKRRQNPLDIAVPVPDDDF